MTHDQVTSLWTYIGKTALYNILTQDNVSLDHEILFVVRLESNWFDASIWWRHQMETFAALLALCAGNSPVAGEFPAQRPVTRSFDVFFDLRLYKRLSKQ